MNTNCNDLHRKILSIKKSIIEAIENNESSVELKFGEFLDELSKIGPYDKKSWSVKFTQEVWSFFETVSETNHVATLLCVLDERITRCASLREKEPLEFVRIEILMNCSDDFDFLLRECSALTEQYPSNLEFINNKANALYELGRKESAIPLYRRCINTWGEHCNDVIKSTFSMEIESFNDSLEAREYVRAREKYASMKDYKFYNKNPFFHNVTLTYGERIKDRECFDKYTADIKSEIMSDIKHEFDVQNRKSLEHLGIFSAIITFIITAAASALNATISQSPLFIMMIGLVLLLFVSTISLFSNPPKRLFADFRFYFAIVFLLTTIYSMSNYEHVNSIITKEHKLINANKDIKLNNSSMQVNKELK